MPFLAESAPGHEWIPPDESQASAPPTLPPFPPDYQDKIRAMPVAPPPPPGPLESTQTTLRAWQAAEDRLELDEWMAERIQMARAEAARGPIRPGTWVEAAAKGREALDEWLHAQLSLSAMAERAAAGQRIADEAVARLADYEASFRRAQGQPDYQAGRGAASTAASVADSAAGGYGVAQLLVVAFDKLGEAFVRGPKTGGADDPHLDPTSDAFARLPLLLRLAMGRGAARLPAWPHEDILLAWDAQRRLVGPKPPLLRLAQEAKRRGLWPSRDALWPLAGNTHDVAGQLRAMMQVALEADAAAAVPPAVPPPPASSAADVPSDAGASGTASPAPPDAGAGLGGVIGLGLVAAALAGGLVVILRRRRRPRVM